MNTKEIMLKALEDQLKAKNEENKTFEEIEVSPKFNDLSSKVKGFFLKNDVIDENIDFHFNGDKIEFNDIKFYLNNSHNDYKKWSMTISWYGSHASLIEQDKMGYLKMLGKISNILPELENHFFDWYKEYRVIYELLWNKKNECNTLQNAINSLRYEIENDLEETFKKIGFELRSFKEDYDWNLVGEKYIVQTRPKHIQLQIGRSQYDTTWVNGYKILGKKGNKYEIEIYKDGHTIRTYNILEKKMDDFISNVRTWETKGYEKAKQNAESRADFYNKRKN